MRKYFLAFIFFTLFFFLSYSLSFSQTIHGFVYEKGDQKQKAPLVGANLFWLGSTRGTFTDENGKFYLNKKDIDNPRLVVSLLGFRKDTILVNLSERKLDIELVPDQQILNEVVIQGRQDNTFLSKLNPVATTVITTGELQRAACCNLAESFETNAAIDVSFSDAITGARQIQLLGLSGMYSQIMTENIPLLRGLAVPYGLSYIPGPWMESIQISKGTASVVNGYESMTGQINVEYKKPERSDKLFVNLFGNSNLRIEANGNGSAKLSEKLSTMLFGHVEDFRHKFDRNHDGFMDLPLVTSYSLMNRWDYIKPEKWISKFGIKYIHENRKGGQMSYYPNGSNPSEENTSMADTSGISDGSKLYGIGIKTDRVETFWKNGFFLDQHETSLGLILSAVYHKQNGFYGINTYNGLEKSIYANLILNVELAGHKHKLSTGLSYVLDDYRENYLQNQLTYWYQVTGDTSNRDLYTLYSNNPVNFVTNRTEWVPGVFTEYTFDLEKKFTLIAGFRLDYNSLYGLNWTPRLHLRYNMTKDISLRGSVGKGYRTANVLAENNAVFVSQKRLIFTEDLNQEEAWNFGLNFTIDFKLFGHKAEFSLDGYRTAFSSQVIIDMDSIPTDVFFYNLTGRSFSNSLQTQLIFAPVHRMSVTVAFRYNDVRMTYNGQLREKPMVNKYKGLISIAYATKFDQWKFDLTAQLNGPMRLPDTRKLPVNLQRSSYSPAYINLLAQITRKFKRFEIYLGGENLANVIQENPLIEPTRPYHTYFDGTMVWGPITGISIYAGLRYSLK